MINIQEANSEVISDNSVNGNKLTLIAYTDDTNNSLYVVTKNNNVVDKFDYEDEARDCLIDVAKNLLY